MAYFLEMVRAGLVSILLHPVRNLVTVISLVAVLVPFVVGIALSSGLQEEADISLRAGADLYITGNRFGRRVPIPRAAAESIRKIEGVTDVVPRIVGHIVLGKDAEPVVLVGLPLEKMLASVSCVEGRLCRPSKLNELVVGTELARRLKLKVGSLIPPFYTNDRGEKISEVVGLFRADSTLWQARVIFTSLDTAATIFNQDDVATDLLVYCRPDYDYEAPLRRILTREPPPDLAKALGGLRIGVTSRKEVASLLPEGLLGREGIFHLHFVLAFIVAILAITVTSGFGLAERRREIGILKATGWQTDEVLLRSAVETVVLGLVSASIAILLAWVWLRWFNGFFIASIFLGGVGVAPSFQVPFRLAPVPVLLGFVLSLVIVATGTLYSSWRAATVPPAEAMR
jgi:ABC-type lipoprotein release transport system permease subunit